ncbi:hypothetical protein CR513_53690, partial [Mucuna pruriens]
MKGVGSYLDWPYYASPNSNLSAFAAPFSVNPYSSTDASSHFMDSTDSAETVPPIHFPSYAYDFFSNPVRELDSAPQFPHLGLPSYPTRSSLVESQPYHAPYASSAIHDHSSSVVPYHWSSAAPSLGWSSLGDANKSPELGFSGPSAVSWTHFSDFNGHGKGKSVGVGSSLSSKETIAAGLVVEDRMNQNQGNQGGKDSANSEVSLSHMFDWEHHNVLASGNQLHDTSSCWGTIKPMPVEFSGTSVMQSPVSVETYHEAPLKLVADSGNSHLLNTGSSYDKHSRHDDNHPLRVHTVSSMPMPITGLNIEKILADEHSGHNNFYNTKEAYHVPSIGTAGCFDSGHLRMHLGRNEPSSSNKAISDRNISKDVADFVFRGRHGFQNPHANMDNLSLRLSAIEDVNFVEKSFEGGDRCNPAEDSPCWKGASAACFSHFEPSASLPPEYVHKKEGFGFVIQQPQNYLLDTENSMKKSSENSNGYQMHTEIVYQETNSAGSPRKFSVTKFASEDCKSGGAVNDGSFQSEPSCDFGLQFLDFLKMKEYSLLPDKPTDCEPGSSHTEHQVVEENKLMSQKQHSSCIDDADAECNVNKFLEYGTSHTAEHALSSPSSVADTTTTPEISTGKVSTEKLNVEMLVDTMQSLSELLLCHCSNGACELKERECNVLKNVISNLNNCASKNAEQIAPAQECLFNQPETSNCAAESCEFQQIASFMKPQLTKIELESSKVEYENPLVAEANLHFRSGKPHGKLSDCISPMGDTEMTKADNMTKDLKRILSENFHDDEGAEPQTVLYKNLWLEAEAALCSVYYKARFNQMKIEMEKHSYKEKEMEKQSKSELVPTLSQSQSSATRVQNYPNPASSALKLPVLDATNLEELSHLNFFTDMNKPNAMTPEGKGGQNLDSIIDNHTVSCSNEEAEANDEASVMARYQVLKARDGQSCIDTTNLEEPLDIADKSASRGRDNQNQVNNFCQDSPIPEKSRTAYEASVVARFCLLKSRDLVSCSISSEGEQLDGVGSAGKGMDGTIAKNVSDVHVNPAVDKSILKEFHLNLEDNQEIQPCGTCEFQLPTCYSDGFSSDWEHVEKS